jgi:phage baseplate assembly protein W
MNVDPKRLGTDLWLLDPTDSGDDRSTHGDLRAVQRGVMGVDIGAITRVENLKQALLLRLLTPRGELAHLGHPDYGSRLHTLIGELNSELNRNRAKLFVLEALAQEPRIGQVLAVTVTTNRRFSPTRVDIAVSAEVAESKDVLNLVFPFFLG